MLGDMPTCPTRPQRLLDRVRRWCSGLPPASETPHVTGEWIATHRLPLPADLRAGGCWRRCYQRVTHHIAHDSIALTPRRMPSRTDVSPCTTSRRRTAHHHSASCPNAAGTNAMAPSKAVLSVSSTASNVKDLDHQPVTKTDRSPRSSAER
jgi:hypothetical protein